MFFRCSSNLVKMFQNGSFAVPGPCRMHAGPLYIFSRHFGFTCASMLQLIGSQLYMKHRYNSVDAVASRAADWQSRKLQGRPLLPASHGSWTEGSPNRADRSAQKPSALQPCCDTDLHEAGGRVHAPAPLATVGAVAQHLEQPAIVVDADRGLVATGELVVPGQELVRPEPAAQRVSSGAVPWPLGQLYDWTSSWERRATKPR